MVASILIILHAAVLYNSPRDSAEGYCWQWGASPRIADVLVAGIISNYAAVAADTFSSELGILAKSNPRLITAPWRSVPKGTNGGVTIEGILAGAAGAFIIALSSVFLTPYCSSQQSWNLNTKAQLVALFTGLGVAGSLLDSLLGAVLQASVVDIRTGKVVEGAGGAKVLVHAAGSPHLNQKAKFRSQISSHEEGAASVAKTSAVDSGNTAKPRQKSIGDQPLNIQGPGVESRKVEAGWDVLSNNGVNLLMAVIMSLAGIGGACAIWDVNPIDVLEQIKFALLEFGFKAHK